MKQTTITKPLKKNVIVAQVSSLTEFLAKQRENKRFGQTVEISATFFLISVFLFSAVRPAITTISSLVGEIRAKQSLSDQMRSKINDLVYAQDAFSDIQEKYSLIESSLPSSPRFAHAAIQLKNIAHTSDINLNEIKFDLNDEKEFSSSDFDMTSFYSVNIDDNTTNFSKIPFLVQDFSNNRRLIKIDRIELSQKKSKQSGQEDEAVFNASIKTNIYYWSENDEKTKNL